MGCNRGVHDTGAHADIKVRNVKEAMMRFHLSVQPLGSPGSKDDGVDDIGRDELCFPFQIRDDAAGAPGHFL